MIKAMAIYTENNQTLTFAIESDELQVGDSYDGQVITAIYTGIETDEYNTKTDVPWYNYRTLIKKVVMKDTISPVSTRRWFDNFTSATNIDVSKLDTSNTTTMFCMFQKCLVVEELDVGHFNTSNVTNMGSMFYRCEKVKALDVSKWNVSKVTDMQQLFELCLSLTELDVSNWDTSNVTTMKYTFSCTLLITNLDLSRWDVSKVTNMYGMIAGSTSGRGDHAIVSLGDISNWNVENVTDFSLMFYSCSSLKELDLSKWNTLKAKNMSSMFYRCGNLEKLDLSSLNTSSVTTMASMFFGCNNLQEITLGENFVFVGTNGYLPIPSSTYIDGADGNWYTMDGDIYTSANLPNSTYAVYYASPLLVASAIWDRDKCKYVHLAAMRVYHDMRNANVDARLNDIKEELDDIEEISSEEILSLFSTSV